MIDLQSGKTQGTGGRRQKLENRPQISPLQMKNDNNYVTHFAQNEIISFISIL